MSAVFIFAATFAVVLFLGLQSLNVNGGHKFMAVFTSFGISMANLYILKIMPGPTDWMDQAAYMIGGPLGIYTSMCIHPWMAQRFGKKST